MNLEPGAKGAGAADEDPFAFTSNLTKKHVFKTFRFCGIGFRTNFIGGKGILARTVLKGQILFIIIIC